MSIAWTGDELIAWDYLLDAGTYDPRTDQWAQLPPLPLQFSECYPDSAVLADGRMFAWFCGQAALLEPTTGTWGTIRTPAFTATRNSSDGDEPVEQIAGGPTAAHMDVYFAGAAHDGQANDALWRWGPAR